MTTVKYDQDIVAWANEQAALLRAGRYELLDIEHIADDARVRLELCVGQPEARLAGAGRRRNADAAAGVVAAAGVSGAV